MLSEFAFCILHFAFRSFHCICDLQVKTNRPALSSGVPDTGRGKLYPATSQPKT
jgi:hypothetical protein